MIIIRVFARDTFYGWTAGIRSARVVVSSHVRELIPTLLEKLEHEFGEVVRCRLVVRAIGALEDRSFQLNLHLKLSKSREINIGNGSGHADQPQTDLAFAVRDAFRKASRQLQRFAQKNCYLPKARYV